MKKSIQRLGILAISASLLVACGNDSNKKSVKTGTTTFFHYVTGSSTLSLESESNNRGLGTVDFQSFGPGITLASKTWDLTVTDLRDETDGSDDVLVLENATFPVTTNIRTIHALIGDYDMGNVELVSLPLGYDVDVGSTADKNGDGIADTKAIYLNISSIYQDTLKVYLAGPACQNITIDKLETDCPAGSFYLEEVDFKESTASIRLKENTNKYYLRIASSTSPAVEIYNSGEQVINDALEQTIIIAPYAGAVNTGSRITAFYFANAKGTKWLASDSKGQIRVLNALKDSTDLNFLLDNVDIPSIDALFHKGFGALSSYALVDTKHVAYSLLFDEAADNTPFASVLEPIINVQDGQSWTVIPFGRIAGGVDTKSAVIVLEEDAVFSNKATVTVSNAGYVADEDLRKPYNVHITTPNEPVNSDSVDIPLLGYADYGTATVNAGNTYKVSITDELNKSNKATPVLVSVEGGENLHFVLMEKVLGGGFEIVRLIGDAAVERTTIDVSSTTASTSGAPVTITVTLKDIGGNKLADSTGKTVTLAFSSASVVASAVTNNGNGTYTATITNTATETVVISGQLDGNDIADTATVIFN